MLRQSKNSVREYQSMAEQRPYDLVSNEYYDPDRHPTCANFRDASRTVISGFLGDAAIEILQNRVEVGAGASLLAEIVLESGNSLESTYLVDSSMAMLGYSRKYLRHGAVLILGDASCLPFKAESADLIVSSLGDPFNTVDFWQEASRVLRPGGKAIFTTPAYEWAHWYRSGSESDQHSALFELRSGLRVATPSHIYPQTEMTMRFASVGLEVRGYRLVRTDEVVAKLSHKLLQKSGESAPVLEGYLLGKN